MLEVQNVEAGYGSTTVLHDVSLRVPTGSVVALLGPNGAGKSTLLRTVSGLIKPTKGQITFDDDDISGMAPYQLARRGVCCLPEGRGVFPSLSVRENLILQAPNRKENESIERAIEAFPLLGDRLHQRAGTLSGGQQQMLGLARAWVRNPQIVLVDEASMGLAPLVVEAIFEFLRRIAAEGVSLLLVEQYVARALELADRAYVLVHGQIAFEGSPAELQGSDVFASYLGAGV